jgi:hypothetical protein
MNLAEMLALVRRDLQDEEETTYRWTDEDLERHIARAVKEFSEAVPQEIKAAVDTVSSSREIDIAGLTGRVMVEAVEYPIGRFPPAYRRFSLWGDVVTLLEEEIPDGSDCNVYYGKLHDLDASTSTLPEQFEDLVACGACGYAAAAMAAYSINRVNTGGTGTAGNWEKWSKEKLAYFRSELKRLGRRNRVRTNRLYVPGRPVASMSTDGGPG